MNTVSKMTRFAKVNMPRLPPLPTPLLPCYYPAPTNVFDIHSTHFQISQKCLMMVLQLGKAS